MTIGKHRAEITRVVAPELVCDIMDIRNDPTKFMNDLDSRVAAFVEKIPVSASHATPPAVFISVEAYMVRVLIWGYAAELLCEEDQRCVQPVLPVPALPGANSEGSAGAT